MIKLTFFSLYSFTIFYDLKIYFDFLTFANLSLGLIGLTCLIKKDILSFFFLNDDDKRRSNFLLYSFFFIFLLSIIDIIHQIPLKDILISLVTKICILFLLPFSYYLYLKLKLNFLNYFNSILLVHLVFIFLQIFGYEINISNLIPKNSIITTWSTDIEINYDLKRLSGAVSSPIFLSYQLLFIFAYNLVNYSYHKKKKNLLFSILTIFILFLAQSRAAVAILLPSAFLSYMIFVKFRLKNLGYFLFFIFIFISIYIFIVPLLETNLPYLTKSITPSDTHRTYTNYYISIGVLKESPLIGINPNEAWNLFDKYSDPNYANIYSRIEETPTHHNQFFFYLRYYGLIGLILFIFLIFKIFKSIKNSNNFEYRFLVGMILILDVAYSLTHNNKLISPLIWMFLSFVFIQKNNHVKN